MDELETRIKQELEQFWDERAIPSGPNGETTVDELLGPLESMTAVDVLATLEGVVGDVPLPNTLIKAGGYSSKDEFVEHLSKRVMDLVKKTGK